MDKDVFSMKRRGRKSAKTRTVYKTKTVSRRGKKSSGSVKLIQPDAMVYGGVRKYISDGLASLGANVPVLSQVMAISDEAVLGLANYFIAKKSKGFIKSVAMKGLVIENARGGETLAGMALGGMNNGSSSASSYTYG
jgi:hypothetical protein